MTLSQNGSRVWSLLFPFIPSTVVQVQVSSQDDGNNLKSVLPAASLAFSLPYLWSILPTAARGHSWAPESGHIPSLPTTLHGSHLRVKAKVRGHSWTPESGHIPSLPTTLHGSHLRVKAKVLRVAHKALSDLTLFSFLTLSSINWPLTSLCSTLTGLLKILQTCQAHFLLRNLELNALECLECFCPDTCMDNSLTSLTSFKSLFQSFLINEISSDTCILCSLLFPYPGIHASSTHLVLIFFSMLSTF